MPIQDLIPKLKGKLPDNIYNQLPGILKFGIDGPKRLSHFLGQAYHESGGFRTFTENLNYSAARLLQVFPKYFKTAEIAAQYDRKPEKIGNRVYANRMGNGSELSGEGYKFRGRGVLQTTGKSNYKALSEFLGVDLINTPDLVATDYALASAAFFFNSNGLWTICDQGVDDATIIKVTKRVNGGTIGLLDRINHTEAFYKILTS